MSENNKTRNKCQRLLLAALKAISSPEAARATSHLRHAELRGKLVRLPQNYRAGLWDPAWWARSRGRRVYTESSSRTRMLIVFDRLKFSGVVWLICVGMFFAAPQACAQSKTNSVVKAYIDSTGARHIVRRDSKDVVVPKQKDEVDSSAPVIADDNQSVGWLVYYENSCCTQYPIPLGLLIYRPAGTLLRLGGGMMICAWHFIAGGKQVAFYTDTVHGGFAPHYELHDVRTGRLVEKLDGPLNEKSPRWTDGLE
jgi:hypothetical protein